MDLLEAGRVAYEQGRDREAYDLWKRAVIQQPKNEDLWAALYEVVTTADDRRACLENILQINPKNAWARATLRAFDLIESQTRPGRLSPEKMASRRPQRRIVPRLVRVFLTLLIVISVILFGMALQILLSLPL